MSNVDYFVSVDTNTISQMRTFFKNQLNKRPVNFIYVPNYVDKKVFCPKKKSHDKIKILFPRRCAVERGFWLVSDVLPEILEQYPFVEFEFVGFIHDEDIKAKLGALIDLYPERVKHLLLEPEHMPDCYKNADITLIPTIYSEGTSLSCLEAMACGNFVIATNIGGLTNLIINNYNGILINPDKNELKQALKNALEDKSFFECVCNNAQSVSDTFEKRVWIQQWNEWQYTRKFAENGDWILIVDADEFYDKRLLSFKQKIPYLNKNHYECVKVSCRDMWTKNKFRCDGYWSPKGTDVRLIAFQDLDFCNNGNNLHLPCYPAGLNIKNNYKMFIPKIHLAYLREKDRKRRYEFYTNAKNTDAHSIKHAKSILEVKPKLKNLYNSFELILDKLFSVYENPIKEMLDN